MNFPDSSKCRVLQRSEIALARHTPFVFQIIADNVAVQQNRIEKKRFLDIAPYAQPQLLVLRQNQCIHDLKLSKSHIFPGIIEFFSIKNAHRDQRYTGGMQSAEVDEVLGGVVRGGFFGTD
jgi:hypothetical protein